MSLGLATATGAIPCFGVVRPAPLVPAQRAGTALRDSRLLSPVSRRGIRARNMLVELLVRTNPLAGAPGASLRNLGLCSPVAPGPGPGIPSDVRAAWQSPLA